MSSTSRCAMVAIGAASSSESISVGLDWSRGVLISRCTSCFTTHKRSVPFSRLHNATSSVVNTNSRSDFFSASCSTVRTISAGLGSSARGGGSGGAISVVEATAVSPLSPPPSAAIGVVTAPPSSTAVPESDSDSVSARASSASSLSVPVGSGRVSNHSMANSTLLEPTARSAAVTDASGKPIDTICATVSGDGVNATAGAMSIPRAAGARARTSA
mmetsp:Transcript_45851/g.76443  ORF Transcript_45851/g.76443 Transcript_45851/m.76443 type:complete len:216 (+) Transcript_45851:3544-4191(+)